MPMDHGRRRMNHTSGTNSKSLARCAPLVHTGLLTVVVVAGCRGRPLPGELKSRHALETVRERYRPGASTLNLPALTAGASLHDYLLFAMLNNPSVEAAYYNWAASVEEITTARSLPDPRLTFEADVADSVMALMPGLMMDFPGPGKLKASGQVAAAQSIGSYFAFEQEVLRTANSVKTAYFQLGFLQNRLAIQREALALLDDLEVLARQQNAAGKVTLQDVLRAQIERERLHTDIENLEDSRSTLIAQLKAALGLVPAAPDPPMPTTFEASDAPPDGDAIWRAAVQRNPALQQMRAEVAQAEAMIELARRSGVPDFSLGLEADIKASPTMFRPSAGVTLPIWRDKIEAEIAAAQARKVAADARLTSGQISLATDLAAMLYMYRESNRNIELLHERLLPKAGQSLEAARSGYVSGRADFLDVIDAQRALLDFELSLIEARTQRELALSALSLLIAGQPPEGAPVLRNTDEPSEGAASTPSRSGRSS